MSLRKRREAAAACAGLVIGALAEAFPRALSVCARRRVPTALGIYRALLVAVQAAIIAGTVTAKDLKTALRRYITSNGYLCACRQAGAARIDLAGNVVGTVTPAEANHAREFLTERRRKKPAALRHGHPRRYDAGNSAIPNNKAKGHGALSVASMAEGVLLRHDKYPTS